MDTRKVLFFLPPELWRYHSKFFQFYCCYWSHYRCQMSTCLFSLGFIFGFWYSSLITIYVGVNFLWFNLLGLSKFMSSINSSEHCFSILFIVFLWNSNYTFVHRVSQTFGCIWTTWGGLLTNEHSDSRIHEGSGVWISDSLLRGGCCRSITELCSTLCHLMNSSAPGFPVLHCLPEFAQHHVHWVSDAIQPSHPLSSPSPPAFNLSQHQGLF